MDGSHVSSTWNGLEWMRGDMTGGGCVEWLKGGLIGFAVTFCASELTGLLICI